MDDVIILVAETFSKNEYGVPVPIQLPREVFAEVKSVSRQEFFEAGRNGLNPQFQFTVFAGDYNGETICRYNGDQYSVYRTYWIPGSDYVELYVERKGGSNNVQT